MARGGRGVCESRPHITLRILLPGNFTSMWYTESTCCHAWLMKTIHLNVAFSLQLGWLQNGTANKAKVASDIPTSDKHCYAVCFCTHHLSSSWWQYKMWKEQSKPILTSGNTLTVDFSLMVVLWRTRARHLCHQFTPISASLVHTVTELCHVPQRVLVGSVSATPLPVCALWGQCDGVCGSTEFSFSVL